MRTLTLFLALASIVAACAVAEDPPQARTSSPADEPLPADLRTRQAGEDWPCFLGPRYNSSSAETGILTDWGKTGPPMVWQRRLGTGYAMPVVARGRLFQFDRAGDEARLTCLKAETGDELWQFRYTSTYEDMYGYDNGPRAAPTVDGPRVYCLGAEGMLHCLRAADGTVLWKIDTQARFGVVQNFFGVGSAPLVWGDLLIVPIGGSPPDSETVTFDQLRGNGSGIVAFDKRTGEVRYQLSDELASYATPVPATIGGRPWCFAFARGGLIGFDPRQGTLDFHYPWRAKILESVNASNPVVVGDLVLISETYGPGASLVRVRPNGYEVVWSDRDDRREKILQTHWNTPVHHEGFVYASSGRHSNNAELRCVELATGNVRWSQPGLARASLLLVDGHLICLCEYGELLLLRATPEKFDLVAAVVLAPPANEATAPPELGPRRMLEYPAWAAPILSHGLLYLRGKDRLVCLELIAPR